MDRKKRSGHPQITAADLRQYRDESFVEDDEQLAKEIREFPPHTHCPVSLILVGVMKDLSTRSNAARQKQPLVLALNALVGADA